MFFKRNKPEEISVARLVYSTAVGITIGVLVGKALIWAATHVSIAVQVQP